MGDKKKSDQESDDNNSFFAYFFLYNYDFKPVLIISYILYDIYYIMYNRTADVFVLC